MHAIVISASWKENGNDGFKIQLQTTLVDCSRLNLIMDSLLVSHWTGPRVYVSCNVDYVYVQANDGVKHMFNRLE